MKYNLFLFDLDDTLLDFKASEKLSFTKTVEHFDIDNSSDHFFDRYKIENEYLWQELERGKITKDFLKVERFKKTLSAFNLKHIAPEEMANYYLCQLPNHVVLIDGAVDLLKSLKPHGEIGIITNGIKHIQDERIKHSDLKDYIDFVAVSEVCGFAKPDVRFFEYASKMAKNFSKEKTIIIGDRLDADVLGAINFGIDSCWFNRHKVERNSSQPTYEVHTLPEIKNILLK